MIRRCFSDAFNMNFSKDNLELRSRELRLLFGENIGQAISEWFYDSFNLVYEMQFQELTIEPVEGLETERSICRQTWLIINCIMNGKSVFAQVRACVWNPVE